MGLYNYRGFIFGSVKREFQSRYKTSMLGAAWLVIQPLSMILVYTLIFSQVMKARLPGEAGEFAFSIYLCAGVLTWGLFAEILNRCKDMFINNANLIKKLTFPKICLPTIVIFSALINFLIIFALFLIFLIAIGKFPPIILLIDFFIVLILQIVFTCGLGMIIGVLNVFFRDIGQLVDVALQFLFWGTPIIYTIDLLPESVHKIMLLNPLARLIGAYQNIFMHQQSPDWFSLLPIVILSIMLCILGFYLFRKHAADMVDEL